MVKTVLDTHKIASQDEWLKARKQLLTQEKEFTRLRDQLSQQRRELPWVKVEKNYSRGIDILNPAYNYLDLVPKGRDEAELEWPMDWLRYHDKYEG